MTILYDDAWLWLVIVGFIIAFVLAFGLGANDVANSFGTSVGAKVLTIRQACILGSIFDLLGAVLLGAKVSDTIRKGIVSADLYTNADVELFMAGNVAALAGSCVWLLFATFLKMPVSGTHSIVGATLGYSIVLNGFNGIGWVKLGMIGASWFISPFLSGLVSSGFFLIINALVLRKEHPLEPGLRMLPIFYAVTVAINLFSIFYEGSQMLHLDKIPLYGTIILTIAPAVIVAIGVRCLLVPRQRRIIQEKCRLASEDEKKQEELFNLAEALNQELDVVNENNSDNNQTEKWETTTSEALPLSVGDTDSLTRQISSIEDDPEQFEIDEAAFDITSTCTEAQMKRREIARDNVRDKPETAGLFSFLQILTAIFGSFAHGGNDVSNAIGPVVALWVTAITGNSAQKAGVPIWVLCFGGVGISVGLWVWGRRVMKTMGEDLTKITPSSGFCIEIGSALTVLIASNIGIPISTTHCKVGSVVCVGRVRSRDTVDWRIFRNILLAWCVTLPASGLLSAAFMAILRAIIGSGLSDAFVAQTDLSFNTTMNATAFLGYTQSIPTNTSF